MADEPLVHSRYSRPFSFYNWTRSLFSGPSNVLRHKFRSSHDERISGLLFISLQLFLFSIFNLGLNIPSVIFASKSMHSCVTPNTQNQPVYDNRLPTWLMTSSIIQMACGLAVILGYTILYLPKRPQSYALGTGKTISYGITAFIALASTLIAAATFYGLILVFSNSGRFCRQSKDSLGGVAFGLSIASIIMGMFWIIENSRTMYLKMRADIENEL